MTMKCFTLWASRALGPDSQIPPRAAFGFSWRYGQPPKMLPWYYLDLGILKILRVYGTSPSSFYSAAMEGDEEAARLLGGTLEIEAFPKGDTLYALRYIEGVVSGGMSLARASRGKVPTDMLGFGPWRPVDLMGAREGRDAICPECRNFFVEDGYQCPGCGWSPSVESFFAEVDGIYVEGRSRAECKGLITRAVDWLRELADSAAEKPDPDVADVIDSILDAADSSSQPERTDGTYESGMPVKCVAEALAALEGGRRRA